MITPLALLAQGWRVISLRHRMIARLPEGTTGLEALRKVSPGLVAEWERRLEEKATETYLRCWAVGDCKRTLSEEEFAQFLRLRHKLEG